MKDKSLKLYYTLIVTIVVFAIISLMMVYSASFIVGIRLFENSNHFIIKQLISYIIGFVLFFIFMKIDYEKYEKYKKGIFWAGLIILVIVLIPGVGSKVNGAVRWIKIGPLSLQPAEFSKIFFILSFAGFLTYSKNKMKFGSQIIIPATAMTGAFIALILMEKDMGTAVHIFMISFFMLVMSNIKVGTLLGYCGAAILAGIPLIMMTPHRRSRIEAYVDGMIKEGVGGGYQVRQSVIGIGNGGFFGLGYSNGRQKYFYLPELHTDFIFSVISEEGGFIAVLWIVFLYMVILFVGVAVAKHAKDRYGRYVAVGITVCVVSQAAFNIAVASGLIPAKGIPLPFISYGGSSVMTMMILMGILVNILKKGEFK